MDQPTEAVSHEPRSAAGTPDGPQTGSRIRRLYEAFGPDWRTLLSGLLIVASFPPWDLFFLIWFAPVPWLWALDRAPTWRRRFREGVWLSFLMTIGGFSWIAYALRQFGGIPWALAILGLCFFALVGQPQFHLYALARGAARGFLTRTLPPRAAGFATPLLLAFLYTALDWISPRIFFDTFGHSQYLAENIRQLAEYGGAQLLTFLIWWHAEALWRWASRGREALRARAPAYAAMAAILAVAWGAGRARKLEIRDWTANRSRPVRMAAIQANIGDFEKLASEAGVAEAAAGVVRKYLELSSDALNAERPPDVVVWPETAYPSTFRTPMTSNERARDQMVEAFVRFRRTPLLFGGYDHAGGKDFNALFLLEPESPEPYGEKEAEHADPEAPNRVDVYRKNVLLPFGEYIPFAENWEWIHETFPQIGFFGRGEGPSVHEVKLRGGRVVRIAPIICYEALLPWYLAESAAKGSEVILNITNDSWFGPFGEPHLHLSLVAFRSIETRRAQFRATNTGISALVLPDGTISEPTEIGAQTVYVQDVPVLEPEPPETLVVRLGDWFGPFSAGVALFGLALPGAISAYRRRAAARG